MNFQRGSRQEAPEVSLIPLIDVVLVIIIFLMLTTTFSRVAGLEITLPHAESGVPEALPHEITVAVTVVGEVLVDGRGVASGSIEDIADALGRQVDAAATSEPVVVINADAGAAHQRVIDVMQAAQRAGLPNIRFAIQAPDR